MYRGIFCSIVVTQCSLVMQYGVMDPGQHWFSLQWCHNERDGVLNHQRLDCLPNRLFRRRSKEKSKLRVTGLCEGNSPVTSGYPAQGASNAEKFPFDDVIMYSLNQCSQCIIKETERNSEIRFEMPTLPFMKMHLKLASEKCQLVSPGMHVLNKACWTYLIEVPHQYSSDLTT